MYDMLAEADGTLKKLFWSSLAICVRPGAFRPIFSNSLAL